MVKQSGAFVVSSLLIPANHEVVPVSTVSNSSLVHDTEVVAILEDLLASFVGMYANNLGYIRGRSL